MLSGGAVSAPPLTPSRQHIYTIHTTTANVTKETMAQVCNMLMSHTTDAWKSFRGAEIVLREKSLFDWKV